MLASLIGNRWHVHLSLIESLITALSLLCASHSPAATPPSGVIAQTDQVRRLELTHGQLSNGPRLIVDKAATMRRIFSMQAQEAEEQRALWEHRSAHRLGWPEEWEEPRTAPASPLPSHISKVTASFGRLAAGAAASTYSFPRARRSASGGSVAV